MTSWQTPERPLVLASQSPRRKEILAQMGLFFRTISPDPIDENSYFRTDELDSSLRRLAVAKARSVAEKEPESLVIGADTVVVKSGVVLGKPKDADDAFRMIRMLSGTQHTVFTGLCLMSKTDKFVETRVAATNVLFRGLTDPEIREYLAIDEYKDKAGAYAVQGRAMIFVERIEGCYYNVVGLPVSSMIDLLKQFSMRKELSP